MKWVLNFFLCSGVLFGDAVASFLLGGDSHKLRMSLKADPEKNEPAVVKIEKEFEQHSEKLMNVIDRFRAEICAGLKDEHGKNFETFTKCHEFMKKACVPGKDRSMNGEEPEISTGKGYCKEYFPEAERKAKEEIAKEEKAEAITSESDEVIKGPSPGPSPAASPPGLAPASAEKASAPAKTGAAPAGAGVAPAPGPMGAPAPGPSPVPAPFIPGISGGKPWGAIGTDEAYYYKGDGKDASRLHMSESLKLPAQGYWGKLIEHEDMKTSVGDWQQEFGPKSLHNGNLRDICKLHPESEWCQRRGFGRHAKSSSPTASAILLPFAIVLVMTGTM
jgi:hypothetical protein